MYQCRVCKREFATATLLVRHKRKSDCKFASNPQNRKFACRICGSKFNRKSTLSLHNKLVHRSSKQSFVCPVCDRIFHTRTDFKIHKREHEREDAAGQDGDEAQVGFAMVNAAHRRACEHFRLVLPPGIRTVQAAFAKMKSALIAQIRRILLRKKFFKLGIVLYLQVRKSVEANEDGVEQRAHAAGAGDVQGRDVIQIPIRAPTVTVLRSSDIPSVIADALLHIQGSADEFLMNGSGWTEDRVIRCDLEVAQCRNLAGSCSLHEMKFVWKGKGKKNIVTKDEHDIQSGHHCFFLAVAAYFLPTDSTKEQQHDVAQLLFQSADYDLPVAVKDIWKFEKANEGLELNISVVYMDEDDEIFPVRAGENLEAHHQICLQIYYDHNAQLHYSLVRDPAHLFSRSTPSGQRKRVFHCMRCFSPFCSEEALKNHHVLCKKEELQFVVYPEEGSSLSFKDFQKMIKSRYVFFFDFETSQKVPERKCSCILEEECPHKTFTITEQYAVAYSLILLNHDGKLMEHDQYVGDDAAEHFLNTIISYGRKYGEASDEVANMIITPEQQEQHNQANFCDHCSRPFSSSEDPKVRHHCHKTGKYLATLHSSCNLTLKETCNLVGFAHNFAS